MENNFFIKRKNHEYVKDFYKNLISWDKIIQSIDDNLQSNSFIKVLSNFGMVLHDIRDIEEIYPIMNQIIASNPGYNYSAHAYISFSKESKTFGKHKDNSDVWFWQSIGSTKWTVYDEETNIYILNPGDMIYVPSKMYHDTSPLSPRVGISFGID
jgi:mannose-6-phosphate isomerase-like protein (cupin superfamily)